MLVHHAQVFTIDQFESTNTPTTIHNRKNPHPIVWATKKLFAITRAWCLNLIDPLMVQHSVCVHHRMCWYTYKERLVFAQVNWCAGITR